MADRVPPRRDATSRLDTPAAQSFGSGGGASAQQGDFLGVGAKLRRVSFSPAGGSIGDSSSMTAKAIVDKLSDGDRRMLRFIGEFHADPSFWETDQVVRLRAHNLLQLEEDFIRLSPLGEQARRLSPPS
jgi:hypothetical protein